MLIDPMALDDADELTRLLFHQAQVLSRRQALELLSAATIRHRVNTGRWQQPHRAVYAAHNGPLNGLQRQWVASLAAGNGLPALLGGASALQIHGLRGYRPSAIHLLLPVFSAILAATCRYDTNLPPRSRRGGRSGVGGGLFGGLAWRGRTLRPLLGEHLAGLLDRQCPDLLAAPQRRVEFAVGDIGTEPA